MYGNKEEVYSLGMEYFIEVETISAPNRTQSTKLFFHVPLSSSRPWRRLHQVGRQYCTSWLRKWYLPFVGRFPHLVWRALGVNLTNCESPSFHLPKLSGLRKDLIHTFSPRLSPINSALLPVSTIVRSLSTQDHAHQLGDMECHSWITSTWSATSRHHYRGEEPLNEDFQLPFFTTWCILWQVTEEHYGQQTHNYLIHLIWKKHLFFWILESEQYLTERQETPRLWGAGLCIACSPGEGSKQWSPFWACWLYRTWKEKQMNGLVFLDPCAGGEIILGKVCKNVRPFAGWSLPEQIR